MPFAIKIDSVEYEKNSTAVSGHLVGGRYFGPEAVEVPVTCGKVFRSCVTGCAASNIQGWPHLPEHNTHLTLRLAGSPRPHEIAVGAILTGLGFAESSSHERRLANEFLELPVFWSGHYYMLIHDEKREYEDLAAAVTGVSSKEAEDFLCENFLSDRGPTPHCYFRIPLITGGFVEVECADDVEYQTRYKIGDDAGTVLVGYASGHFSLPGFRWCEIQQIACNAAGGEVGAAKCLLLLFPSVYLNPDEQESAVSALSRAFDTMEVFARGDRMEILRVIVGNVTVGCGWHQDATLGWVAENLYAQRNPDSMLSQLDPEHFQRIKAFFAALS